MLGTNRTERKEKCKKILRYQGFSMEPQKPLGNLMGTSETL